MSFICNMYLSSQYFYFPKIILHIFHMSVIQSVDVKEDL